MTVQIPENRRCGRCHERWIQGAGRFCRRCQLELGLVLPTMKERDAEKIARAREHHASLERPTRARILRTAIIDGREWELETP